MAADFIVSRHQQRTLKASSTFTTALIWNMHPEHVNCSADGDKVGLRTAIGATGDIKRSNDVLTVEIRHSVKTVLNVI